MQTLFIASALAVVALPVYAQSPVAYTAAQAAEGQSAYAQNCAGCHGGDLDDGEFAPALKGTAFSAQWGGKSVGELFTYISTKMPPSNAGGLGDAVYLQITAFVLQSNGVPLDAKNLPGAAPQLRQAGPIALTGRRPFALRQLDSGAAQAQSARQTHSRYRCPAANPPPGEWLTWRRTYDDLGFSPLKQINKSNVAQLRSAWSWSLPSGRQ